MINGLHTGCANVLCTGGTVGWCAGDAQAMPTAGACVVPLLQSAAPTFPVPPPSWLTWIIISCAGEPQAKTLSGFLAEVFSERDGRRHLPNVAAASAAVARPPPAPTSRSHHWPVVQSAAPARYHSSLFLFHAWILISRAGDSEPRLPDVAASACRHCLTSQPLPDVVKVAAAA